MKAKETKTNVFAAIKDVFEAQQAYQYTIAATTLAERRTKLKRLLKAVEGTYRRDIQQAIHADFGKHPSETELTEIYPVIGEIRHALQHLSGWMQKERVKTPIALWGSSSYVNYEPKGVCLLISPWNFPFNLTFGPLSSAIAAGNTVMIKPSEHTPHTSALMKKMISAVFEPKEIALFEGEVAVSTALLALPFHHIFFTGSPEVGKIVMQAAAKHLTSVTLELGGKSPAIIDETAAPRRAAKRIVWGKFVNAGQTCIAPDYVYVHQNMVGKVLKELERAIQEYYGAQPLDSQAYAQLVNARHYERVVGYLETDMAKGATIAIGGDSDDKSCSLAPTIVLDPPRDGALMNTEIFGPILPVLTYTDIDEVIHEIRSKEKPLALYIYSTNKRMIKHLLHATSAGGSCVNTNVVHYFNAELPFGGVNTSGIGKAHGIYGFKEFSNARAVYVQHTLGASDFLVPPYTKMVSKLIRFAMRWF